MLAVHLFRAKPAARNIIPIKEHARPSVREANFEAARLGDRFMFDYADGHFAALGRVRRRSIYGESDALFRQGPDNCEHNKCGDDHAARYQFGLEFFLSDLVGGSSTGGAKENSSFFEVFSS